MSLTFKVSVFQAMPVDVPVRLSGFLERGRPRPLNPPLMQTQLVLVWIERRARFIRSLGPLVPQADGDVRARAPLKAFEQKGESPFRGNVTAPYPMVTAFP